MSQSTTNPPVRVTWAGKPSSRSWRQLVDLQPRVLNCESVEVATMPDTRCDSVRQISFQGRCILPADFFTHFPDLKSIRVAGEVTIATSQRRLPIKKIEFTDFHGSVADVLQCFEVERIDITGSAKSLPEALEAQSRLAGLRLQETNLDMSALGAVLPKLQVLCLYRTAQKNYDWIKRLTRLEMLSIAHQSNFTRLDLVAELVRIRILDVSSQRKLQGYEELRRLRDLVLLSFLNLGLITSIRWAESLSQLRVLKILEDCTIADGKVAFLAGMPSLQHVMVQPRKGYDADPNAFSRSSAQQAMSIWESELPEIWKNPLA
jgi:hypothetical protein